MTIDALLFLLLIGLIILVPLFYMLATAFRLWLRGAKTNPTPKPPDPPKTAVIKHSNHKQRTLHSPRTKTVPPIHTKPIKKLGNGGPTPPASPKTPPVQSPKPLPRKLSLNGSLNVDHWLSKQPNKPKYVKSALLK